MVTLHDTRFVECRWWNDGWSVKTVDTRRSSASMIPAPREDDETLSNSGKRGDDETLTLVRERMTRHCLTLSGKRGDDETLTLVRERMTRHCLTLVRERMTRHCLTLVRERMTRH